MEEQPKLILKVISISQAVLHEEPDLDRVRKYTRAFTKSGLLIDPPVVTPLTSNRYLVLDGANRVSVFRKLGIPYIAVQVVEYGAPAVRLETWNHLICDRRFPYRQSQVVTFEKDTQRAMLDFVRLYNGHYRFQRVVGSNFLTLKKQFPNATALVVFPRYTPQDITQLTRRGEVIPSGITRHIINGRALGVNLPLHFFKKRSSLRAKNAWLTRWVVNQRENRKLRFYGESTYIFYQ